MFRHLILVAAITLIWSPKSFAAEYFDEPMVGAVSRGLESLRTFVQHAADLSEHAEIVDFVDRRLEKLPGLKYLNREQPFGAFLYFPKQGIEPAVLIVVPITDFEALKTLAITKFNVPVEPTEQANRWKINGKKKIIFVEHRNGNLFISERVSLLDQHGDTAFSQMQRAVTQRDLVLTVRPQSLPQALKEIALLKINSDIQRDLENSESKSPFDHEIEQRFAKLVMESLPHLVQETEIIEIGVVLTPELRATATWTAATDSKLANTLQSLQVSRRPIASHPTAAAAAQFSVQLPAPIRELLLAVAQEVKRKATEDFGKKLALQDREPVGQVFQTLGATIQAGTLNTVLQFQPVGDKFALITALELQEEEGFATSLRAILPYLEKDKNVSDVETNVIATQTAKLHRISNNSASRDDREIYGENPSLFVGTSMNYGWFAVGNSQTATLLAEQIAVQEQSQSTTPTSAMSVPLIEIHWSFRPWIELAIRNESKDEMLRILQQAFPTQEQDAVHFELRQQGAELQAELHIEQGYHTATGIVLGEILNRRTSK